jgi:Tfp pilus assembly protein PilF
VVRIDPGFAQGHNSLAVAFTRANRLPEAAEHFQRAVALAPNFEDARVNLRRTRESLGLAP